MCIYLHELISNCAVKTYKYVIVSARERRENKINAIKDEKIEGKCQLLAIYLKFLVLTDNTLFG